MKVISLNQASYIKFKSSESEEDNVQDGKPTTEVGSGTELPSYDECGGLVPKPKDRSSSPILKFEGRELEFVWELSRGRLYKPNIFVGETLCHSSPYVFEIMKNEGIKTVIDLDGDDNKTYSYQVQRAGMEYYSYPIMDCVFHEKDKEKKKERLVDFIKKVQEDNVYIGGMNTHNIDTAAHLNSLFNPKFKEGVKASEYAPEHYDGLDIFAKDVYECMTEEDKKSIGWTPEFESEFVKRINDERIWNRKYK